MSSSRDSVKVELMSKKDQDYIQSLNKLTWDQYAYFGDVRCNLPATSRVDYIRNDFVVYPDDLWIVTPPKCGTTWTQEIVWYIRTNVDEDSAKINQFYRIPFLELGEIFPSDLKVPEPDDFRNTPKDEINVKAFMSHSLTFVDKYLPRPRIIKTHLPLELLPKNLLDTCKVIYVGRNVKDMAVSWYYHQQISSFTGTFPQMAELFKAGKQTFTPYFPHILGAWKERGHPNIYFTMYEDMKADLAKIVTEIAAFMGKSLTQDQLLRILELVDIKSFRNNKYVNKEAELDVKKSKGSFIRKGIVGDWKNHFTPEMNAEWDPWIEENLKGSGLKMVFKQE